MKYYDYGFRSNVMDETEDGARGVDAIPAVFPCDSVFEGTDDFKNENSTSGYHVSLWIPSKQM